MKQDVEIIIRLHYKDQSAMSVDNEPSMSTVRRDLYEMIKNESLSYESIRTNAQQSSNRRHDATSLKSDFDKYVEDAKQAFKDYESDQEEESLYEDFTTERQLEIDFK